MLDANPLKLLLIAQDEALFRQAWTPPRRNRQGIPPQSGMVCFLRQQFWL